jgi:type II secretory pathway predicted ATPase ExeA
MILDHFGWREEPFGMTPDPAYLYASRTHTQALASLSDGIRDTRGFLALIAEPGMGKTTLLYQLAQELRDTTRIVHVSQTQCDSREFIQYILQELGVDVKGIGFVAMHGKLNEILFEELLAGKRFLLIVDEAQNLDESVLETVRMLSNFETHNAKLLQIVLAGQPQLAAKLSQPRLSQLRQRIAVLGHLQPFSADETGLYIAHRLKVAGYTGVPIFDEDAVGLITRYSKGIPRNINNFCYNALRLSHARGLKTVTPDIVQEAAALLDMESLAFPSIGTSAVAAAAHASATAAKVAGSRPAPLASASEKAPDKTPDKTPQATSLLTYDATAKTGSPKWPGRSATVGIAVLAVTMVVAILVRSESRRGATSENINPSSSSNALGATASSPTSEAAPADYDAAAPLDTGDGQVLTVAAGPQETVKDLSIRYNGRFDSELADKIKSLNPDLKDLDHLDEGQLIRIPLPPGAMKKVNDTGEPAPPPKPPAPQGFFGKLTAMLRGRK